MSKLKVDLVSRELGRHKGDVAHLIVDAKVVERAVLSARGIAAHCGHSIVVFDQEHEVIVSSMIDHIFHNMQDPAIDLLSDFRDEYVATKKAVIEMHLKDVNAKGQQSVLRLIPTLRREQPATVRVHSIAVEVVQK